MNISFLEVDVVQRVYKWYNVVEQLKVFFLRIFMVRFKLSVGTCYSVFYNIKQILNERQICSNFINF